MSNKENAQTTGEEQVDATQQEETQEEAVEESTEDTQEESKDDSQNIDYKAILEEERKRREEAEKSAADYAYKLRNQKREEKGEDSEEESDEDAPLTRKELNEALQSFSQKNEKTQQEVQAKQLISQYTSNDDEAEAAYEMWKNRIVPTGNLQADIMFAIGGLNHKRVLATNEELKRSLTSKDTKNRDASGTHKKPSSSENQPSSADAQALKASGMKWNTEKQVYAKKLKDGKTFYFDPKTNKRWKE